MELNRKELTLEESIAQMARTLPPAIRDYLAKGKYVAIVKMIAVKNDLRVDQAGVVERELILFLLGSESPEGFATALAQEGNMDEKLTSSIMQDVNDEVLTPLRQQMMGAPAPRPTIPAGVPQVSRPSSLAPQSQPSHFHLENKLGPNVQEQPKSGLSVPLPSRPSVPAPSHVAPLPPKTAMPRPLQGPAAIAAQQQRPMLPVGEGKPAPQSPSINILRAPSPQPKSPSLPGRVPAPGGTLGDVLQSISKMAPPPPNLPGAMPPTPSVAMKPPVQQTPPPAPRPLPPPPPRTPGTDPYREPIE